MLRRAVAFLLISTAAAAGVFSFHGFSYRDDSLLNHSLLAIGACLLYVISPGPFNHVGWFLIGSVPLWLLARSLHVIGALGVYGATTVLFLALGGATLLLDVLAYEKWGAIGSIGATIILIAFWILFWRYLNKLLSSMIDQLPKFLSSWVQPIDKAIANGHDACDRLSRWLDEAATRSSPSPS